jgi:hypothetical protein
MAGKSIKFIVSERGQWDHPGKPTAVPTKDGRITMQGVPYPVMGYVPGYPPVLMEPGGNYQFPGKMVYEIPMGYGGDISIPDLNKAQIGLSVPSNKDAFGKLTSEFYNKWKKPTNFIYEERTQPTVEKEEDVPVSYRRNMGEITTKGIQQKLRKYDPSLEVDGVWGPLTEKAYRKYWNKHQEDKRAEVKLTLDLERSRAAEQELMYRPEALPSSSITQPSFTAPKSTVEKWRLTSQGDRVPTKSGLLDIASQVADENRMPGQSWDFYNEENPLTGKPLKNYTESELLEFVNNSGAPMASPPQSTLAPAAERSASDYIEHYYDILSNPTKAARMSTTEEYNPFGNLKISVPNVPFGFADQEYSDPTGDAISMVNPLTYVNAAGRLTKASVDPDTYFDLGNLAAAGSKSLLNYVSGDNIPISDQQEQSAFRGLNTVADALTVLPVAQEASPFVKGFAKGSVPSALEKFSSWALTPSKSLTQIERGSLESLRKASNILNKNKIGSSPGVSKSTMKMITSDPKLLMDFQESVKGLHPDVVRNLIGKNNFDEFSKFFKTDVGGLGPQELSRIENLGLKASDLASKMRGKLLPEQAADPRFMKGYNLIEPPKFIQNSDLDKTATTLVPQLHASDKDVMGKLREAFNKIDAAEPGELFVGSSNMSVDSYAITNSRIASSVKDGSVAVHSIKMAPLNNQGIATATKNPNLVKAAVKKLNEEIKVVSEKINVKLPEAYFDPASKNIIAPYVVVEKTTPAKLVRAKVKIKTPSGTETEIKYVKPDGSDLKSNETILKIMGPDYTPVYKPKPSPPIQFARGGQLGRSINSYNDFVTAWNS